MSFELNGYAIVLWAAAIVSTITTAAAWARRDNSPGGRHFAAMMSCVLLWCLMAGMEATATSASEKILFSKLCYVGICGVAPLFLRFASAYAGREKAFSLVRALLVWTIPLVTLALVFSNEWHHLVWAVFVQVRLTGMTVLLYEHGPWYWIWLGYNGFVTLVAVFLIVQQAWQCRRIFAGQTLIFLAGTAMPWVGEVLYASHSRVFPGLDFLTIGFAAMGALLLLGMSRFSLFDLVPVACSVIVDRMSDGMVVLDRIDRVVGFNPAAQRMLDIKGSVIGLPGSDLFIPLRALLPRADAGAGFHQTEVSLPGDPPASIDVIITPLQSRLGMRMGRIIVLRNVTLRRLEEEERERLISELRAAQRDLKTLRGLLPICSSCKRIRDDSGYWHNLEQYIQDHTEAHFSHGICNECVDKLYPGLSLEDR